MVSAVSPNADATSRRLLSLTQSCVRCGLCQPHCPTYALDKNESESPRGRITLAAALAEGRLDAAFDDAAAVAINHCLGCGRCESACPAGVKFDDLLVDARTLIRRRRTADARQRALEWAISQRWPLALGWAPLRFAQRVLPSRWLKGLPSLPERAPAGGMRGAPVAPRGRVALFTGCVARQLDADVHRAAIRVLHALGWDVWLPSGVVCCGALHRHAGADGAAAWESRSTRDAISKRLNADLSAGLDDCSAVLVAASGCYSGLSESLSGTNSQVAELLAFIADDARLPTLNLRPSTHAVIVHTPCTQSTQVGRADAAARVLAAIPKLVIRSLPDSGCCGAAGSHVVLHHERADALRSEMLNQIEDDQAITLCSGNIGCRLHLAAGLKARNSPIRARHPIEILAEHLP